MSDITLCDGCDKPFPERQIGSVSLTINAAHGFTPETYRPSFCKHCNPFLRKAVKAAEERLALMPPTPMDKLTEQIGRLVDAFPQKAIIESQVDPHED